MTRHSVRIIGALVAGWTFLGTVRPSPRVQEREPFAVIDNVTVIDGRGGAPLTDAVVVLRSGRIHALGRRGAVVAPVGAQHVDGSNGFLLPGFIDMHAHVALGPVHMDASGAQPVLRVEPDPAGSRRTLAALLAHGVTTARDPGGPATRTVALRDSVADGHLPGPRLFVAGEAIDLTSFEGVTTQVASADEVRVEVRRQAAAGVDLIKLYAFLSPELMAAGIEEAHRHGLPAIAHPMRTTWTEAARLGIDGIVHIIGWSPKLLPDSARARYQVMLTGMQFLYGWLELADLDGPEISEAVNAIAQRCISFDPTLVVFERAVRGDDPAVTQSAALTLASPAIVENWRTFFTFNIGWSPEDYRRARAAWPNALRLTRMLYEKGVLLTAGTDANNPWTPPGESFHRELELLVEAGIPPLDVIAIATRNGAQALGILDETGTIEVGKRADLVLLAHNPLDAIAAVRSVQWVMKGGRLYRPQPLLPGGLPR